MDNNNLFFDFFDSTGIQKNSRSTYKSHLKRLVSKGQEKGLNHLTLVLTDETLFSSLLEEINDTETTRICRRFRDWYFSHQSVLRTESKTNFQLDTKIFIDAFAQSNSQVFNAAETKLRTFEHEYPSNNEKLWFYLGFFINNG